MGSSFLADTMEIDNCKFSLIWVSLKKFAETTDWILMVYMDTKKFYEGILQHETIFLKMYKRLFSA